MRHLLHESQLAGMEAVVVGAGRSGVAAARLLSRLGASVRVVDGGDPATVSRETRAMLDAAEATLEVGPHSQAQFHGAQMVVLSPGVARAKLSGVLTGFADNQIISELELASWFVSEPAIAVTGTNGKTTTTTLIAHILEAAGKKVFAGGNLGTPLSQYLLDVQDDPARAVDILVLEVSSFQLQATRSFAPHVGVLLNFSANHLDWHADMAEYFDAKLSLFARMGADDLAILPYGMKDELDKRDFTEARKAYFVPSQRFASPSLPGEHNRANMEAAWLAVRAFGVDEDTAASAVETYVPMPHRLESVDAVGGVSFVNDSKATTTEAVAAAVQSFDAPVRLLMGGVYKGGDLPALRRAMMDHVASVHLFGDSQEIFEPALADRFDTTRHTTLEEAMREAHSRAKPGDVVLLSPATASFDQYADYTARGDDFRRVVELLKGGGSA